MKEKSEFAVESIDYNPFSGPEIEMCFQCPEPQSEILTACALGDDNANKSFNLSFTLIFKGELHKDKLERAIQSLVNRHEALRATYSIYSNQICILKTLEFECGKKDISTLTPESQTKFLTDFIKTDTHLRFDLELGPLIRATIIKLSDVLNHLVITVHHIAADGWSLGSIASDLGKLYSLEVHPNKEALPLPATYSSYALELREFEQSTDYERNESFWLNQYLEKVPQLNLPVDVARRVPRTYSCATVEGRLKNETIQQLRKIGTESEVSFAISLLSVFEYFLKHLCRQDDIVVGVPTAYQAFNGKADLIGHCVNFLPFRSKPKLNCCFRDYLSDRKEYALNVFEHQQFTFGSLLKKLRLNRDPSRIPLAPVVYNLDIDLDKGVEFSGLNVEMTANPKSYGNFELFMNIRGSGNDLKMEWFYNTYLFKESTVQNWFNSFCDLLDRIVESPDIHLSDVLDLIKGLKKSDPVNPQKFACLTDFFPVNQCIEKTVVQFKHKTAVEFNEHAISYEELNKQSNALADYILQCGLKKNDIVAIAMDRSSDKLIAILGVLKAGGAFLPIDIGFPSKRIEYVLADSMSNFLITQSHLKDNFHSNCKQILFEDFKRDINQFSSHNPDLKQTANDLAYVMYTSGSTGLPKGVLIEHGSLTNLLYAMRDELKFKASDRFLGLATISFDISLLELLLPLICGGTLVMLNPQESKDRYALQNRIKNSKVNFIQATPSTFKLLIAADWKGSSEIILLSGGEALSIELARMLLGRCKTLWNMYGPTEATIWATMKQIKDVDTEISIGRPIKNNQVYILGNNNEVMAPGQVGEICIGGAGLAKSYLNRPELNAEKFIVNHDLQGEILYKTGDLGKMSNNGEIYCLGRNDEQLKVRGYRIETGEIEYTLRNLPELADAVLIAHKVTADDVRMIAFVQPNNSSAILGEHLASIDSISAFAIDKSQEQTWKTVISSYLPDYMLPSVFIGINQIPLNLNNKTDRNLLSDLTKRISNLEVKEDLNKDETEMVLSNTVKRVKRIWENVLGVKKAGITDNFFESGGHSLLAIQFVIKCGDEFKAKIKIAALFEYPNIRDFANYIDSGIQSNKWKSLVSLKPSGTKPPVYLIHGAGLGAMVFTHIAGELDPDQPAFGIQALGEGSNDIPLNCIKETAAFYISEIIEHNPNGPYQLAGLSSGSLIAYEMARQLQESGKQVKSTIFFDFDFVIKNDRIEYIGKNDVKLKLKTLFSDFLPKTAFKIKIFFKYPIKATIHYKLKWKLRWVTLRQRFGIQNDLELQHPVLTDNILKGMAMHESAIYNYEFKPYNGPLNLFIAKERMEYRRDTDIKTWKKYGLKGIFIHEVTGNHDDMILPPNHVGFASLLQSVLDQDNK